jgi:hypothetical protein
MSDVYTYRRRESRSNTKYRRLRKRAPWHTTHGAVWVATRLTHTSVRARVGDALNDSAQKEWYPPKKNTTQWTHLLQEPSPRHVPRLAHQLRDRGSKGGVHRSLRCAHAVPTGSGRHTFTSQVCMCWVCGCEGGCGGNYTRTCSCSACEHPQVGAVQELVLVCHMVQDVTLPQLLPELCRLLAIQAAPRGNQPAKGVGAAGAGGRRAKGGGRTCTQRTFIKGTVLRMCLPNGAQQHAHTTGKRVWGIRPQVGGVSQRPFVPDSLGLCPRGHGAPRAPAPQPPPTDTSESCSKISLARGAEGPTRGACVNTGSDGGGQSTGSATAKTNHPQTPLPLDATRARPIPTPPTSPTHHVTNSDPMKQQSYSRRRYRRVATSRARTSS